MNIIEAFKYHSKVRRSSWDKRHYIVKDRDKNISLYYDGHVVGGINVYSWESVIIDDWEVYKEPIKYLTQKEAMIILIQGGKIKRDRDGDSSFFKLSSTGFLQDQDGGRCEPRFFAVPISDYYRFYEVK